MGYLALVSLLSLIATAFGQYIAVGSLYSTWYYTDLAVVTVSYSNKAPVSLDHGDPEEYRKTIFDVCRKFFGGAWNLINHQEQRFLEIGNDLKTRRYYCGLPLGVAAWHGEMVEAEVVLDHKDYPAYEGLASAAVSAYTSLIQRQLGGSSLTPVLLGSFCGGHLEEHVPNNQYFDTNLMINYADAVVRKIAFMHSLHPPIPNNEDRFFGYLQSLLGGARSKHQFGRHQDFLPDQQAIINDVLNFNFETEIIWLRAFLDDMRSPVVNSHFDLNQRSIILVPLDGGDNQVSFVNIGDNHFNYRAYDLAAFFNNWREEISASSIPYPHFIATESYPDPITLDQLAQVYLLSIGDFERNYPNAINNELKLLDEIRRCSILHHLTSAINAIYSTFYNYGKRFGFPEFAQRKIRLYLQEKQQYLLDYPDLNNILPGAAANSGPNNARSAYSAARTSSQLGSNFGSNGFASGVNAPINNLPQGSLGLGAGAPTTGPIVGSIGVARPAGVAVAHTGAVAVGPARGVAVVGNGNIAGPAYANNAAPLGVARGVAVGIGHPGAATLATTTYAQPGIAAVNVAGPALYANRNAVGNPTIAHTGNGGNAAVNENRNQLLVGDNGGRPNLVARPGVAVAYGK